MYIYNYVHVYIHIFYIWTYIYVYICIYIYKALRERPRPLNGCAPPKKSEAGRRRAAPRPHRQLPWQAALPSNLVEGKCQSCSFFRKGRCAREERCTYCHYPHDDIAKRPSKSARMRAKLRVAKALAAGPVEAAQHKSEESACVCSDVVQVCVQTKLDAQSYMSQATTASSETDAQSYMSQATTASSETDDVVPSKDVEPAKDISKCAQRTVLNNTANNHNNGYSDMYIYIYICIYHVTKNG